MAAYFQCSYLQNSPAHNRKTTGPIADRPYSPGIFLRSGRTLASSSRDLEAESSRFRMFWLTTVRLSRSTCYVASFAQIATLAASVAGQAKSVPDTAGVTFAKTLHFTRLSEMPVLTYCTRSFDLEIQSFVEKIFIIIIIKLHHKD